MLEFLSPTTNEAATTPQGQVGESGFASHSAIASLMPPQLTEFFSQIADSAIADNLPTFDETTIDADEWLVPHSFPSAEIQSLETSATPTNIDPITGQPEPGNTPADARNLGNLTGTQVQSDFVGNSDRDDFYRFTLDNPKDITLELNGMSADADLGLLRSPDENSRLPSADFIDISVEPFNNPEQITYKGLQPGTYLVQVHQFQGNTPYNLTLSAQPTQTAFNSGYGFGLVDAAAAVNRATNAPAPFSEVPDLGGNNAPRDVVRAPEVWNQGITGANTVVAVVDGGVDYDHIDLNDNIWRNTDEIPNNGIDDDRNGFVDDTVGWDFVDGDASPDDPNGHGTHVAGAIAAENNNIGITGVAPDAQIMPVRAVGSQGAGNIADIVRGIRYAADNGADVINLSLGTQMPSPLSSMMFQSAINYASDRGAVTVMAAGNSGGDIPASPANLAVQQGIAVGATDNNGNLADFSNRAGAVSLDYLAAPGVEISSTLPNDNFGSFSGTSMAAPHVSGAAALIQSVNPHLTPTQVEDLLTETARSNVKIA
ncbi:S8 family serine peptidase [Geitlerinema sp. PCC 9228]|uniref:S8 family serine peptidase n=1 Tax=Geitlerinema sp. PCC 9228 TaxID=111611 RepID=UPI0008F9C6B8|nr:S8 family serine peptidase [Geitlerinema sp. PCC 9228]